MSDVWIKLAAGVGLAGVAVGLSLSFGVGQARAIVLASVRAIVQLTAVAAAIALVFEVHVLAFAFVAVMALAAGATSGGRLGGLAGAFVRTLAAIAVPALLATGFLLAVGAFDTTPRAAVPTAGILIGGAMAATTLCGRRLMEALEEQGPEIETRLALGDDARTALAPAVRRSVHTGLVPVLDQTRTVGLVTLPGTFVGLVLGGAEPEQAAATQLVVLLALLAVELGAALLIAELIQRSVILPGERIAPPGNQT